MTALNSFHRMVNDVLYREVVMSAPGSPESDAHPPDVHRDLYRHRDDVRMTVPDFGNDDDDPPLELAPVDPATETARRQIRDRERSPTRPADVRRVPPARWQFSLAQLIIANTILAVMLSTFHLFAPSYTAGALGLAAFSMFLYVTIYQPDHQEVYALAWALIGLYILVAGAALLAA